MKFAHSYWTAPRKEDYNYITDLWFAAVSVEYIHKLGYTIDLYTDTKGKEVFSIIPYDNIHVILDNMENEIATNIWSASKYKALEAMELGTFHIDYDFFLKDPSLIDSSNVDMFCQNIIPNNSDYDFVTRYIKKACPDLKLPEGITWDFKDHILHQGIFAIFNQNLKTEIISKYFNLAKQVSNQFPKHLISINKYFIPNLLLEEKLVGQIAQKYKVRCMINIFAEDYLNIQDFNDQCEHFAGEEKAHRLEGVKKQLQELNLQLFESLNLLEHGTKDN